MTTILGLLLAGALVAVLVVLGLGVLNMAKGGSPQRSQALMRARVGLQALALVLLLAFLFARS
jgi:hypothetical protein